MRIKTLTAPHMADALKIIREQMGPEALILSTRKVKGPNGEPTLEITAAYDDATPPTASIPVTPEPASPRRPEFVPRPPEKPDHRAIIEQLVRAQSPVSSAIKAVPAPEPQSAIPSPINPLATSLQTHGLTPDLIARLTDAAQSLSANGFNASDAMEMLLGKLLRFAPPPDVITRGHAHVLVGPAGAGKTTMVAKLAIHAKRQNLKVGLMSLDDLKIAGFEPLRIAADAIHETAFLISSPTDLAAASSKLGPRHLILIDTPGLNPYHRPSLTALKQRLDDLKIPYLAHLVLPATHNPLELEKLPIAFGLFQLSSILFSRLDETAHLGGVTTTANIHQLPLGPASNSPDFATAPLTLTPRWMAEALTRLPQQPWELTHE